MAENLRITIKNNLSELERISDWIENAGMGSKIDQKDVFSLNLMLDELLTNIISYGYIDKLTHMIEIDLKITDEIYEILVKDDSSSFNLLEKPDPDINLSADERGIGGLGIYIIKKNADEIKYERINNFNILRIKKKRRKID
jgi:serine/threonine-protein kinase RsbW